MGNDNLRTPLREVQPSSDLSRRKRRTEQYSKRHERRLKKQRSSNALTFLGDEGFVPVGVSVVNKEEQRRRITTE